MKLIEAVRLCKTPPAGCPGKRFYLATGFTPLHLATFSHAYLQQSYPGHQVSLDTGVFGDLPGNIARAAAGDYEGIAIAIEWGDLDPRLGWRVCGGWAPALHGDIAATVAASLSRIIDAAASVAEHRQVAVSLPSLPLPPVGFTPGSQAGELELRLALHVSEAALRISATPRIAVVARQRLDELSPAAQRLDLRSELAHGFPYKQEHADVLGSLLAELLRASEPKKGLITDLDDTIWHGILGEVGVAGVCWDLASHAQVHGLYQQLLHSLSEAGTLIAVASKNDSAIVAEAFGRSDLLLPGASVFPVEASWGAKSAAVGRILEKWNIGPDAVVFVDDSRLELEEVRSVYPTIECLLFPKNDPQGVLELLRTLRDRFGRHALREEDRLRAESLRHAEQFRDAGSTSNSSEEFLAGISSTVTLEFSRNAGDERALELVNKTNQFNLNGIRYTASEWNAALRREGSFLLTASYEDKFGRLGKIAVMLGSTGGDVVSIDQWVMSCRAFSRRIEHQCLDVLFRETGAQALQFALTRTERNGPLREFLASLLPANSTLLTREAFHAARPSLYHQVNVSGAALFQRKEVVHGR